MAEKYTFSVEDSLLDALGFLKKMGHTMLDTAIRPWLLVRNTYAILEYKKQPCAYIPTKNPANKYVSHFLYFVIWALLFLSYYKAFSFNAFNNVSASSQDVIRETNSYLTSTTIAEKLLLYFPVILLMYLFVSLLTRGLGKFFYIQLNIKQKEAVYLFRRIIYYVIGTALMLQLVPMLLRHLLPVGWENFLGNGLRWGYWAYCLFFLGVAFFNGTEAIPKPIFKNRNIVKLMKLWLSGLMYVFFILLMGIACESFIFRTGFRSYIAMAGYLNYSGKVSLESYEGDNNIMALKKVITGNDSTVIIQSNLIVVNGWQNILIHNENALTISFIGLENFSNDTMKLHFNIVEPLMSKQEFVYQGTAVAGNSMKELVFRTGSISNSIIALLENACKTGNKKVRVIAELNYLPLATHNRIVSNNIQVSFR